MQLCCAHEDAFALITTKYCRYSIIDIYAWLYESMLLAAVTNFHEFTDYKFVESIWHKSKVGQ